MLRIIIITLIMTLITNIREAAIAILSHRDWRMAMRNKTIEEGVISTPMRKLIKKLPGKIEFIYSKIL